jgi:hypothetical protein
VYPPLEVSTTQVQSNDHISGMTLETVIVQFNIRIEDFIRVDSDGLHSLDHGNRAEVREERVIDLDVPASGLVQVGDLLAVRFRDVGEVFRFVAVRVLGEGIVSVTEMEPFGGGLD